jgi:hypothetical protein
MKLARSPSQVRFTINDKRVERIWQREGLKVPHKQPKRGRLWLADGSCIRLRPQQRNHVWSYDFVEDRTHQGRKYRMLKLLAMFICHWQVRIFEIIAERSCIPAVGTSNILIELVYSQLS